jgi:hypothetical protein
LTAEPAQEEASAETSALEKCTKQFVLNARKNVKFLSSQQKASQFIAKNASLSEETWLNN